jgi:hypothetical protein
VDTVNGIREHVTREAQAALDLALGEIMSDISELCYNATWMRGTEDILPRLCAQALETGQPQDWGQDAISVDVAYFLTVLADITGHWVTLNMESETPPYVPVKRE